MVQPYSITDMATAWKNARIQLISFGSVLMVSLGFMVYQPLLVI